MAQYSVREPGSRPPRDGPIKCRQPLSKRSRVSLGIAALFPRALMAGSPGNAGRSVVAPCPAFTISSRVAHEIFRASHIILLGHAKSLDPTYAPPPVAGIGLTGTVADFDDHVVSDRISPDRSRVPDRSHRWRCATADLSAHTRRTVAVERADDGERVLIHYFRSAPQPYNRLILL